MTPLETIETWVDRSGREKEVARRAEWAQILLPFDPLLSAAFYLKDEGAEKRGKPPTSTCALVALRFLAVAGCRCHEHQKPYLPRVGRAVPDLEDVARRHGAWLTSAADLSTFPAPGDLLAMHISNPHISVVVGSRASDGAILSVDGGQKDNTWTKRRERRLLASGEVVDLDDGVATQVGRVSKLYARVELARVLATLDRCA